MPCPHNDRTHLLEGGRLVDPARGFDGVADVLVADGRVLAVGPDLAAAASRGELAPEVAEAVVCARRTDLAGKLVMPGCMDIHVHLREPGGEHKEDVASGTRAAVRGGFTEVVCMPNTSPVIDSGMGVGFLKSRAAEVGACKLLVAGACTSGLDGEVLAEMGDMHRLGAAAFTDDGHGIQGAGMMRRVMDYASMFGVPVMVHCQDDDLVGAGQVNEGAASTRLGLAGWPAEGEEVEIARDIALCRLTGCPLHIQHLTTARGLDLVRAAKAEGLPVTCEVTPHHLFLTEDDITDDYPTNLKVNPPLRTREDADALIEGVIDGAVDCLATDHAPHAPWEKAREFELAPFGMTGLETAFALMNTHLLATGRLSALRLAELMSSGPRRVLRREVLALEPGAPADVSVFDCEERWVVGEDGFASKSSNSGFLGRELTGRASHVLVDGEFVLDAGELVGRAACA